MFLKICFYYIIIYQKINMYKLSKNNLLLNKKTINSLINALEIIKTYYKNNLIEVLLFGSYARGNKNKYSSLDILIIINKSNKRFTDRMVEFIKLLNEDEKLPFIEPLIYTKEEIKDLIRKKESFIFSVLNEAVVLWNKTEKIDINNISKKNIIKSKYISLLSV